MGPLVAFILATATAFLTLGLYTHRGDIFKSAPHWLGGSFFALSVILYALAGILAIVHYKRERKKDSGPPPPLPPPPSYRTENRAEANPQQNVCIARDLFERLKPVAPPIPPPKKGKAKIRFVEVRRIRVHAGVASSVLYESEEGQHSDCDVYIACFRNQSSVLGEKIHTPYIQAHIIYKDSAGKEIADVPRAVWVSEHSDSIRFEEGKKKCAVLLTIRQGNRLGIIWNDEIHTSSGSSFVTAGKDVPSGIATVEIHLINSDPTNTACIKEVDFHLTFDQAGVKLETISQADPPD